MRKQPEKLYIVKKYIMASSAQSALRKERKIEADECWVDEDYKKNMARDLPSAIGFNQESDAV